MCRTGVCLLKPETDPVRSWYPWTKQERVSTGLAGRQYTSRPFSLAPSISGVSQLAQEISGKNLPSDIKCCLSTNGNEQPLLYSASRCQPVLRVT